MTALVWAVSKLGKPQHKPHQLYGRWRWLLMLMLLLTLLCRYARRHSWVNTLRKSKHLTDSGWAVNRTLLPCQGNLGVRPINVRWKGWTRQPIRPGWLSSQSVDLSHSTLLDGPNVGIASLSVKPVRRSWPGLWDNYCVRLSWQG